MCWHTKYFFYCVLTHKVCVLTRKVFVSLLCVDSQSHFFTVCCWHGKYSFHCVLTHKVFFSLCVDTQSVFSLCVDQVDTQTIFLLWGAKVSWFGGLVVWWFGGLLVWWSIAGWYVPVCYWVSIYHWYKYSVFISISSFDFSSFLAF